MSAYHSILSAEKSLGYTCHAPASQCGAVASQNTNLITTIPPDKKQEELKDRVLLVKDLVNCNGSTGAGRMIISRRSVNITLFPFDENEGLSKHTAPFDAVVTISGGECEVWVPGQTCR